MTNRRPQVAEFLTSLEQAFAVASMDGEARNSMARIHAALETPGREGAPVPQRLPVCEHIGAAVAIARATSPALERVANAVVALDPILAWARRSSGGPNSSANWPDGHANATIVGPNGLEDRGDLAIGLSLLAPAVRYPDHNHGPEEVYLLLSPGRFQHGESGWFEPGAGGTLFNEPNIRHAMAADATPLLAIWCLWIDGTTH